MVTLSSLRQQVEAQQGTTGLDSSQVSAISGSGVSVYETLDSLPSTGLTAGDEAFVKSNYRLYVSNGLGWYNTTLVNRTPRWDSGGEPDASYSIADSATPLIITARAIDSDNGSLINQSIVSDSAQYMATISNDSSVWTFTPKSADSIGIEVAAGNLTDSNGDFVYTFKWSDGISFVSKAATISYNAASASGSSGGHVYTISGTYNWTAPAGVTSVSVVAVGGGGGGDNYFGSGGTGGGLGWKNNITVIPGQTYTVVVNASGAGDATGTSDNVTGGAAGGDSYFINNSTVAGFGGPAGVPYSAGTLPSQGGTYVGDGGGNGGIGLRYGQSGGAPSYIACGGAGAGGYSGNGGNGGGSSAGNGSYVSPTAGQGGGGGGSGGTWTNTGSGSDVYSGASGGGVGIYGEGSNGAAGSGVQGSTAGTAGGGGSGGTNGSPSVQTGSGTNAPDASGYGGGGAGNHGNGVGNGGAGGGGAVRIIWGNGRSFPSTNVDLVSSLDGESTN
jgi:hypothetical protein|tara:strand:+ start:321 stop:1823 length:1503 start_codon:yes stop_codon:yes gene_type:complete